MTDLPTPEFFDQPERAPADGPELILDLEGFEGPLDLLLTLARQQRVDLTRISILELAEQYLAFIQRAKWLKLEIAADYLVMAAWLAYLKSRLLLPEPEAEEEPTGEELAAALQHQLRRLEAMREAGARLMARPRLGRDVFARGAPEPMPVIRHTRIDVSLFQLLKAYAEHRSRHESQTLHIEPSDLFSIEDALERLVGRIGRIADWESLRSLLPAGLGSPLRRRSALAATFGAILELARQGQMEIRQLETFGPIYVRSQGGAPS
jgi:segregation and condensation protein A